jgi:5'-nucleotidase
MRKFTRMVFVNRTLDMADIRAVGFDMDHTLISYKRESFEDLAFHTTLEKCIEAGYPEELSQLKFDHRFLIRGLLVDIERGNILKIDSHKYVKIAFHGTRPLAKEERDRLYNKAGLRAQEFLSVDTFFALSEIHLFMQMVDYMDANPGAIAKDYRAVYKDLKTAIDLSHQDGSIKSRVLRDPDKYIRRDKRIAQTLARLINSGKLLFLLTNSDWGYTSPVMEYLFSDSENDRWRDYFHYVIVGSGKPGFFTGSQPFFEVMTDSGLLKPHRGPLAYTKAYYGGNAALFEQHLGFSRDEILYVGDHIFGDILKPKGSFNWRTMLVVEELDSELKNHEQIQEIFQSIQQKFAEREEVDEALHVLLTRQTRKQNQDAGQNLGDLKQLSEAIATKIEELKSIDLSIKVLTKEKDALAHPVWGELMRTGLEHSRFADQVFEYACLFTSKVSNLLYTSPFKRYFSAKDLTMVRELRNH